MRTTLILLATLLAGFGPATDSSAQGTRADYERARAMRRLTANKVFRDRVEPHWLPGDRGCWYRVSIGEGRHQFVLVDCERGSRGPAFDHARLAEALKTAGASDVRPDSLPIDRLQFDDGQSQLHFRCRGKDWSCHLNSYELKPSPRPDTPAEAQAVERAPKATTRTGSESEITFVNATGAEVQVFWLDHDGRRRSYGKIAPGGKRAQHTYAGHVWLITERAGNGLCTFVAQEQPSSARIERRRKVEPAAAPPPKKPGRPRGTSPDGKWQAVVRDHNVYLRNMKTGDEAALSDDGTADNAYGSRFAWSPDSQKLVAIHTKKGGDRKVYYVESSPKDQLQPKLHSYDYLKPGDPIPLDKPQLFHVAEGRHVPVCDDLFPNPWNIKDLRWAPDSSQFTFLYNQRGHQVLRVIAVDAASGRAHAIVDERSKTFIDYAHKQFARYLDDTREIVWMSERDGWNHLYLIDALAGRVKNPITKGPWVVRRVDDVDEQARQIRFQAGGIRPGQDPYHVHHCRVNFDGSGLTILTAGDGTHSIEFSPDRRFFVDRWSRVDLPPVTELRKTSDGSLVCELERGDWSPLLAAGWRPPERFAAKGRDGETDIYGVIFRPTNFDPQQKYPVIEQIYAGPHGAFVPKRFQAYHGPQSLAELGFIVVQIDGMGTSQRSKKFHDVCWKNLGDSGFPDRIAWIQAAAEKYPYIDLTRVGIYGGSAGGQSALRALLAHGDFYKVAVADCGCHDNRMDKIWWNELWMGWPVGSHYDEQSNVTQAHRLQGTLLLIVGELDRNVDPASTMQVVHALIQADKDFDLLVMAGAGHGAAESAYGNRRRQDFFVRHLHGVEPRGPES